MRLLGPIAIATTGSDGSATGSYDSPVPIPGRLAAVHIAHSAGQANTTSVAITTKGTNAPAKSLLTVGSKGTGWYNPVAPTHAVADGAAVTGWYTKLPLEDIVRIAVSSADNNETTTVYLEMEDDED